MTRKEMRCERMGKRSLGGLGWGNFKDHKYIFETIIEITTKEKI